MFVKLEIQGDGVIKLPTESDYINFKDLPIKQDETGKEKYLEQFVADNIELLWKTVTGDHESSTIEVIGRQTRTGTNRRMDLVAISGEERTKGDLIVIELKRDASDASGRKDHAEIQVIRYAASLASIDTRDQLATDLYSTYLEKSDGADQKPDESGFTSIELARKKLEQFTEANGIKNDEINRRQHLVIAGASFDADTKAAAAWMAANGLPISLVEIRPVKIGDDYFFEFERIIPVTSYEDFYGEIQGPGKTMANKTKASGLGKTRTQRIGMKELYENKVVAPGNVVRWEKFKVEAELSDTPGQCIVDGKEMSLLKWTKQVSGWAGVNIYDQLSYGPEKKRLGEIRTALEAYLEAKSEALEEPGDDS